MFNFIKTSLFGIAAFAVAVFAEAAPVDLSTWIADGNGSWSVQTTSAPNDTAVQSVNGSPTMFFNNFDSQGTQLSGTIKVATSTDDDFIGFVLGYNDNDVFGSNPSTDYILVDWKQGTQGGWGAGMAISRVVGSINTGCCTTSSNAWQHTGNVQFIDRALTLGNTGWVDNVEYAFDILFTASNIQVFINSQKEFDINGSFENGSFGFYNYSQPGVRYAGITEDIVDVVPEINGAQLGIALTLLLSLVLLYREREGFQA